MLKKLKQLNQGFTIIEVLIVLAIAGLILLIVFLAVPALQRNTRNNGRKNDVARVGAGVNDFAANHSGTLPTSAQVGVIITGMGNMANYATTDRVANTTGAVAVLAAVSGQPRFRVVTSANCTNPQDGTTGDASDRQSAIQYQLETNNPAVHTNLCLDI